MLKHLRPFKPLNYTLLSQGMLYAAGGVCFNPIQNSDGVTSACNRAAATVRSRGRRVLLLILACLLCLLCDGDSPGGALQPPADQGAAAGPELHRARPHQGGGQVRAGWQHQRLAPQAGHHPPLAAAAPQPRHPQGIA